MGTKAKIKSNKPSADKSANIKEPEIFARMDRLFTELKFPRLPLIHQIRMVLSEWCDIKEAALAKERSTPMQTHEMLDAIAIRK
jgi:hypothetical protein